MNGVEYYAKPKYVKMRVGFNGVERTFIFGKVIGETDDFYYTEQGNTINKTDCEPMTKKEIILFELKSE